MGIIWATGFEHGSLGIFRDYERSPFLLYVQESPHTGVYGLRMGNFQNDSMVKIPVGGIAEIFMSIWVDTNLMYDEIQSTKIGLIGDISTPNVGFTPPTYFGVRYDAGFWNARMDIDGSESPVATGSIHVNATWHLLELHLNLSTGVIQTKIDGMQDIDYTAPAPPGGVFSYVTIYRHAMGGGSDFFVDDIVISDDDWLGDLRVDGLFPNADTADKDWTASTGADNFAMLDEAPPNDADFVTTATDSQKDLYELQNWDDVDKTPVGVVHWTRAWKGTANQQKVKQVMHSGAVEVATSAKDLTAAPMMLMDIKELDPNGDIPWSDAAIDALQIGQESVI